MKNVFPALMKLELYQLKHCRTVVTYASLRSHFAIVKMANVNMGEKGEGPNIVEIANCLDPEVQRRALGK